MVPEAKAEIVEPKADIPEPISEIKVETSINFSQTDEIQTINKSVDCDFTSIKDKEIEA